MVDTRRVTQLGVEVSGIGDDLTRVTQLGVEVSAIGADLTRITQLGVEVSSVFVAEAARRVRATIITV